MKKMFFVAFLGAIFADAAFGDPSTFSSKISDISSEMSTVEASSTNIIKVISYVIGLIFVGWGIYDLFIDEDQQHQGKKAKGSLKIIGGGLLIAITRVATWIQT